MVVSTRNCCTLSTERTISVVHRFTSVIMILSIVWHLIIQDMDDCLSQQRKTLLDFTPEQRLSVPLDATNLSQLIEDCDQAIISNVEHHSRRLCFILHGERHKLLLSQTVNFYRVLFRDCVNMYIRTYMCMILIWRSPVWTFKTTVKTYVYTLYSKRSEVPHH